LDMSIHRPHALSLHIVTQPAHWVITYVVSFLRKPTFRGED